MGEVPTRLVRVSERGRYAGVIVRTVRVRWVCPRCGHERGEPWALRWHADGEWYTTDRWVNDCGHVDLYRDVLAEARALAEVDAVPAAEPVDEGTARLLAAVASSPDNAGARTAIVQAIAGDAAAHAGSVDPNRVRERLSGEHGLTVPSRLVGAVYSALARQGHLVPDGWTTSTDVAGGNSGKPARLYRLVIPVGAR